MQLFHLVLNPYQNWQGWLLIELGLFNLSASKPKDFKIVHPYKQLWAFCMSAEHMYSFPTQLRPILRFFLKSIKAKKFEISPKSYSTTTPDWLIAWLYLSCSGVRLVKGPCKWTRKWWVCFFFSILCLTLIYNIYNIRNLAIVT